MFWRRAIFTSQPVVIGSVVHALDSLCKRGTRPCGFDLYLRWGSRILTSDDGVVACVVDELFDPVFEAEFSFDDEVVLSFKEAFFPRLRRTGRF